MAKKLKMGEDLKNAIKELFLNTNEFKSLCNMSVDLIWDNTSGGDSFAAQIVNVDTSSYDFCILTYQMYTGGGFNEYGSKILEIGKINSITDRFYYNSNYYAGFRRVTLNANSIVFSQALNEIKIGDNMWYVPRKLYGVRIGTRVNITPQDITIENKTLQQAVNDALPTVIGYNTYIDANGWTVIDNPLMPYIEYYKRGIQNINLGANGWNAFVCSSLPVGVTENDPIYFSGSVRNWDAALNPEICVYDKGIRITAYWCYGGNGWNANHVWHGRIIKMRS